MGNLTNTMAYVPVFVLIQLFKRSSSVFSKSKRLEKLVTKTGPSLNKKQIHTKDSKSISFTFPWWFKIFLYLFSFVVMVTSMVLVTFKGNFFLKTC
jgi:hypothetical protein